MPAQGLPGLSAAASQVHREGTWLESLPTVVRAGWDQLSRKQRENIRTLRDSAQAAGVRGPHPAEPGWEAAVDLLTTVHQISADVAVCIAYLTDGESVIAAAEHVQANIHRFKTGVSGALMFSAISRDWAGSLNFRAKRARQLAARRAREEAARLEQAAQAAAAEELAARARVQFAALHPLGEAAIRRLIDRAVRRMETQERNCTMSMLGLHSRRIFSGAKGAPTSLVQAPALREVAYAELIAHGPPGPAASSAAVAAG